MKIVTMTTTSAVRTLAKIADVRDSTFRQTVKLGHNDRVEFKKPSGSKKLVSLDSVQVGFNYSGVYYGQGAGNFNEHQLLLVAAAMFAAGHETIMIGDDLVSLEPEAATVTVVERTVVVERPTTPTRPVVTHEIPERPMSTAEAIGTLIGLGLGALASRKR